jgi:nucleoid-associated protein YgaU
MPTTSSPLPTTRPRRNAISNGNQQTPAGEPIIRASLEEENNPAKKIKFQLNPEEIKVTHHAKTQNIPAEMNDKGAAQAIAQALLQDPGETTISLSKVTFYGDGVLAVCDQLMDWTRATKKTEKDKEFKFTNLKFEWGKINAKGYLNSTDISYERFASDGRPIRATVSLTLHALDTPPIKTNPTSGGIPGRRSHTMVTGENLQHIAMANYGRPGAWRALAAANGIEDPLAVRPGTVIYLPAPSELAGGGPR